MTSTDLSTARAPSARLSLVLTGLSVGILVVSLAANTVDPRLLDGAPVWAKPVKFALSFVVLFATVAWLETRLSPRWRDGIVLTATLALMGTSLVAEMAYMMFQAAQGEPSHFNLSTPFHTFMYTVVMFVGALVLVVGIGIFGVVAACDRDARLEPGLRLGVVLGFGLSLVLTVIVAGYMGGQAGHHVGTPSADAGTLPLVGWSTEVGDLRPAHFLSLHAMQVLPLFGWLLDRRMPGHARKGIVLIAVIYCVATFAVFAGAVAGRPLIGM
ncbi:hypothetical protein [Roseibium sp. MMSF_3544]|uniref:hypothetical protein n=1 Tax=unclassified Roseibium TaxID=2629323 RepID=UPI00273E2BF6|nr:hypothetical protein [Roseibium sp. MMSF_3544]